jgi:hypothetical protein
LPPAIHNPFFHVGFIVPDLHAAMEEFELVQSVPGTPLAGNGRVSFHHLGFWTDRLAESSHELDGHGWPCAATVAGPENGPSRFTLQQSRHGFYVELFDTATPRHADLLPTQTQRSTS